jgi:hypothetical protein
VKAPSDKQSARQGARKRSGRYAPMNACEVCDKRLGDYDYFSHPYCCTQDCPGGLVLCAKCAALVDPYPDDPKRAWEILQEAKARRAAKQATK